MSSKLCLEAKQPELRCNVARTVISPLVGRDTTLGSGNSNDSDLGTLLPLLSLETEVVAALATDAAADTPNCHLGFD